MNRHGGGIVKPPTDLGDTAPVALSQGCSYRVAPRDPAEQRRVMSLLAAMNRGEVES
ncbi:hypothetical protein ACXYTP_23350 [Tsukamurella ocularis]